MCAKECYILSMKIKFYICNAKLIFISIYKLHYQIILAYCCGKTVCKTGIKFFCQSCANGQSYVWVQTGMLDPRLWSPDHAEIKNFCIKLN